MGPEGLGLWGRRKEEPKLKGGKLGSDESTPEFAIVWEQKFWVMESSTVRLCRWGTEGEEEVLERTRWSSVPTGFAQVVVGAVADRRLSHVENPCHPLGIELGLP